MKIIFIRHGAPDYVNDTLTEKGRREAELLSHSVVKWDVKDFYCSPLGRAKDTAAYSMDKLNRTAEEKDWLREFFYPVKDPVTGQDRNAWDFMPEYWTKEPLLYDKDRWLDAPVMQTGEQIAAAYRQVCEGNAAFRVKFMGDISHLLKGNEPASDSGFFQEIYR